MHIQPTQTVKYHIAWSYHCIFDVKYDRLIPHHQIEIPHACCAAWQATWWLHWPSARGTVRLHRPLSWHDWQLFSAGAYMAITRSVHYTLDPKRWTLFLLILKQLLETFQSTQIRNEWMHKLIWVCVHVQYMVKRHCTVFISIFNKYTRYIINKICKANVI